MALYDIIGGKMRVLVTGEEMQSIDKYSIDKLGISSFVLMERAALSVCGHIEDDKRYLAICGSGNNGGDAVAVARILVSKGIKADIMLCEENEEKCSEGFRYQLNQAKIFGVNICKEVDFDKYDCIIDGIFGVGLKRDIAGKYKDIIDKINESSCKVISVDCPSGVDCNTGKIMGTAINADKTITFGAMKKGLVLYPGAECAGEIIVEDIGFPEKAFDEVLTSNNYITSAEDIDLLPKRKKYSNKGSYGKAVIIAGSKNMCGAAIMAARACYAMGAGLVKVVTCEENRTIIQNQVPEAILTTYGTNVTHIKDDIEWADVILVGPGLSTCDEAKEIVNIVIESDKKKVLDADALNILSLDNILMKKLTNAIVTPHLGEMSRLIKKPINEIASNITDSCEAFAKENEVVCVLKDARTVISNGKDYVINISGNNGMAKAGSGDVLAGMLAGILAAKDDIYESAILGVYLHGVVGDMAAAKKGKYSMTPFDMINEICNITSRVEANQ